MLNQWEQFIEDVFFKTEEGASMWREVTAEWKQLNNRAFAAVYMNLRQHFDQFKGDPKAPLAAEMQVILYLFFIAFSRIVTEGLFLSDRKLAPYRSHFLRLDESQYLSVCGDLHGICTASKYRTDRSMVGLILTYGMMAFDMPGDYCDRWQECLKLVPDEPRFLSELNARIECEVAKTLGLPTDEATLEKARAESSKWGYVAYLVNEDCVSYQNDANFNAWADQIMNT